jgi:ABC-type multidrug transport system fused ATPase/permease subunit
MENFEFVLAGAVGTLVVIGTTGYFTKTAFSSKPEKENPTLSKIENNIKFEYEKAQVDLQKAKKALADAEYTARIAKEDAERAIRITKEEKERLVRFAKEDTERAARIAKEDAERTLRIVKEERELAEWIVGIVWPTIEEFDFAKKRYQYIPDYFYFAVTGVSGSGKSSLVNAFRGLTNKDRLAAPTGTTETTTSIAGYPDPSSDRRYCIWYDVPGAGTLKVPRSQYFNN